MNTLKMLKVYEVKDSQGLICLITDYNLIFAIKQVMEEVVDIFDIKKNELVIKEVEAGCLFVNKPAYQHVLSCKNLIPQRIFDAR